MYSNYQGILLKQNFGSVDPEWGLRFCTSTKLLSDAEAASLQMTLGIAGL